MTRPPDVRYGADLIGPTLGTIPRVGSWFITHPLGRPAGNTYTEVAFDAAPLDRLHAQVHNDPDAIVRVLDEVVRQVARDLYGTAWAFTYPPEQYDDAIRRHGARRRELVVVRSIDLYDLNPREDRN